MRTAIIHPVAAAALLLAACGGGGDDAHTPAVTVAYTGPTGSATISEETIGTFATAATSAAQGLSGATGGGYLGLFGVSRAPAAGVKQAMEKVAAVRRDGTSLAGAVYGESFPCDGGGSLSATVFDGDDDPDTTSNGDWVEVFFDRCTEYDGSMTDGGIRLTLVATEGGDPFVDPADVVGTASFGFAARFTHFASFDPTGAFAGIHGDVSFDYTVDSYLGEITYEISGQSIAAVQGEAGQIVSSFLLAGVDGVPYSEKLVEYYGSGFYGPVDELDYGFSGRMCSTELGGCLEVLMVPLFSKLADDPYPHAGTLLITADNGAFIQVVALDGSTGEVAVTWDVDGEGGEATVGPLSAYWDCLETAPDSRACFP